MRITLDIPEGLLRAVAELVEVKKKNEAVRIALDDFVQCRRREQLLALSGKLAVKDVTRDLEHAEMDNAHRHRRSHDNSA